MTNKKFLALLMTVSLAFQQAAKAEDVVSPLPEATATQVKLDEVKKPQVEAEKPASNTPETTTEAPILSAAHVTGIRCVAFFIANNILRAMMKGANREFTNDKNEKNLKNFLKIGTLSADKYLGHVVGYGVDVAAPYKNAEEVTGYMKMAEFFAKEINVVGDDKEEFSFKSSKDGVWAVNPWMKMFFKALNRNKLFILPAQAKAVLKNDLVSMTTGMLEGLTYDASEKNWSESLSRKKCTGSFIYGQVAMRSNSLAKDIIAALILTGKMPEALDKFTNTPEGMALVENVLAQFIEDLVNQSFKSAQLHG